ncbi:MAG TPA: SGNH/GDSL hydrolase family protein, partial [Actinomycetota bacterium]|nr:SGNH/GDSL hydrolase family protein [Actinomycetota bacterium]
APYLPHITGPLGCWRSSDAYPALVAAALHVAALHNASCGGAVLQNLWTAQAVTPTANPPQLNVLTASTGLVTVGIGANNAQFVGLLSTCLNPDLVIVSCVATWVTAGQDRIASFIEQSRPLLMQGLRAIRARAPDAAVYVVGYPAVVPEGGSACPDTPDLPSGNVPYVRAKVEQLNAMIAAAAAAAGDHYVDEWTATVGHDLCQPEAARWIEPLTPLPPAAGLHPNPAGEAAMATVVERAIRAD